MRIAVEGDVDLDRVDVVGVEASDAWKVYPARPLRGEKSGEPASRKVFEQDILNFGGDVNAATQRFERWIGT